MNGQDLKIFIWKISNKTYEIAGDWGYMQVNSLKARIMFD